MKEKNKIYCILSLLFFIVGLSIYHVLFNSAFYCSEWKEVCRYERCLGWNIGCTVGWKCELVCIEYTMKNIPENTTDIAVVPIGTWLEPPDETSTISTTTTTAPDLCPNSTYCVLERCRGTMDCGKNGTLPGCKKLDCNWCCCGVNNCLCNMVNCFHNPDDYYWDYELREWVLKQNRTNIR